jgi:hypothetical protein
MRELDLVASRVAYLVDGDQAGKDRREKLIEVGVPSERILVLGEGRTALSIEDLVRKLYVEALNRELGLRHGISILAGEIPDVGRKKAVEVWCEKRQTETATRSTRRASAPSPITSSMGFARHVFAARSTRSSNPTPQAARASACERDRASRATGA